MPTTLYLSPTASSSAAHAILRARRIQAGNPLAPVQFLLPTTEDIALLSVRLGNSLGIRLRQFYRLAVSILDQAGRPHHAIGPAAARRLVRGILAGMNEHGELTSFGPVWDKPGFQQVLLDWLREMKAQGIRPEQVAALPPGPAQERDRQLAMVYERYQTLLDEQEQTDTDGLLWLAADALQQNPGLLLGGEPLLVLGFDQFSRVELGLLRLLSERLASVDIYLLWDETRQAGSLALDRLSRTRQELRAELAPREEVLPDDGQAHPTLAHLRRTVLEPGPAVIQDVEPPAVLAVEAPSREAEARAALRAVKRLLLDGVAPVEIALLTPRPGEYRRIVQAVAGEYGLPVRVEQPLAENPAVSALLNVLGLYPDFAWRGTFDALRSPYMAQECLSPSQIDTSGAPQPGASGGVRPRAVAARPHPTDARPERGGRRRPGRPAAGGHPGPLRAGGDQRRTHGLFRLPHPGAAGHLDRTHPLAAARRSGAAGRRGGRQRGPAREPGTGGAVPRGRLRRARPAGPLPGDRHPA